MQPLHLDRLYLMVKKIQFWSVVVGKTSEIVFSVVASRPRLSTFVPSIAQPKVWFPHLGSIKNIYSILKSVPSQKMSQNKTNICHFVSLGIFSPGANHNPISL